MDDCLFCRIIDRKLPARIVHDDEHAVVIEDIHPQAPVHLLVIPRRHLGSLKEARGEDEALVGHLLLVAAKLARERGLQHR